MEHAEPPSVSEPSRVDVLASLERRVVELECALALRDEFIRTLAYELRNPLSPLYFQAEVMLGEARHRPDGQWAVPRLERFASNLTQFLDTLDRLLDLSQIAATGVRLHLEDTDWAEVLRETAARFQRELELAGSTLSIDAPEPVRGWFDRARLEQICRNLISNAIRYGAGRPIAASIRAHHDEARLRVVDSGIGIPEDHLEHVFDRFERIANGRNAGFGVGLWIVRQLCTAMGGSIAVESALGHGSTFEVTLPRRPRPK